MEHSVLTMWFYFILLYLVPGSQSMTYNGVNGTSVFQIKEQVQDSTLLFNLRTRQNTASLLHTPKNAALKIVIEEGKLVFTTNVDKVIKGMHFFFLIYHTKISYQEEYLLSAYDVIFMLLKPFVQFLLRVVSNELDDQLLYFRVILSLKSPSSSKKAFFTGYLLICLILDLLLVTLGPLDYQILFLTWTSLSSIHFLVVPFKVVVCLTREYCFSFIANLNIYLVFLTLTYT